MLKQQPHIDEKKLIQQLVAGDEMAFELIFYRYRGKVGNFMRNSVPAAADWEELVLDVFFRIWLNREQLDPERPFEHYLFRAARNQVVDQLRKFAGRTIYLQERSFEADLGVDDTSARIEEQELKHWLDDRLGQLPSQRRQMFILSRFEGLSYREIGQRLNISENTVDTQIRRALQFLRAELKKRNSFFFDFFL